MPKMIELPPQSGGDEAAQLQQMWSYLYQLAEDLNTNFAATGGNDLTDAERKVMQTILANTSGEGGGTGEFQEMESLKSLIIKTADFVINTISEFRTSFIGEATASGQFGEYVRQTRLDVDVTPTGVQQNYSFKEIIQGLRTYEINAKNYIKTGLLRTVSSIPVYGVAIGKDIVTFSQDGTETYNDGNKVAELTADELSFWQGGNKVASYTGSRISFFYGNTEVLYISNGKIYCANDLEITSGKNLKVQATNFLIDSANKKMVSGDWTFDDKGAVFSNNGIPFQFQISKLADRVSNATGISMNYSSGLGELILRAISQTVYHTSTPTKSGELRLAVIDEPDYQRGDDTVSGLRTSLYSTDGVQIGDKDHPFSNVIAECYMGKDYSEKSYMFFAPSPSVGNCRYGINLMYSVVDNKKVIDLFKSSGVDEFNIYGHISVADRAERAYEYVTKLDILQTSSDLNDYKEAGRFWISSPSSMSHLPSDFGNATGILDVWESPTGYGCFQVLYKEDAMYTRRYTSSWGSWYKFTGTAV